MMTIITDNATLMRFIPNVVAEVEGEKLLFDKILPQLEITEQWLQKTFTGGEILSLIASLKDDKKWVAAATIVACEAFRRSVPSLDLILTPNGFGVVSNSNVVPASKERVERLIASLRENRDNAIVALLKALPSEDWGDTPQAQWLRSSFFSSLIDDTTAAAAVINQEDRWDGFLELREKARPIEQAIAQLWLGQTLSARLRAALATDPNGTSDTVTLARTVRQLILKELLTQKRPVKDLDRCVNYIRNNGSLYPEWQSDPVAELFEDKWRFKNKKESAGYFF